MHIENEEHNWKQLKKLNSKTLRTFFISHLNYVYCAKELLIKMLPELKEMATFSGVKFAIEETYTEIERQVSRLDSIYQLLDVPPSQKTCNSIKKMIDETLAILKRPNNELKEIRDMSILFYLQNIEGLIMASCQALRIAAFKIKIPQIKGLLKENYVEAKETQALLMLLSSKYISTN